MQHLTGFLYGIINFIDFGSCLLEGCFMDDEQKIDFRGLPIFAGIGKDDAEMFVRQVGGYVQSFPKGTRIPYTHGDAPRIGIVLEGKVHVLLTDPSGNEVLCYELEVGALFGNVWAVVGTEVCSGMMLEMRVRASVLWLPYREMEKVYGETGGVQGAVARNLFSVLSRMMFVQTVNTEKDVRNLVHVPFLGSLPIYKKKERKKGYTGISILENNVQQNYLESIRLIRTRVEKQIDENHCKVIMVTSSVPGEGKSTVAATLAVSLAGKGRPVVLIDCDLRNPSTQETLNIKGEYPGLEAVLAGNASIKQALYSYEEERGLPLLVMPGGEEQADGSNLLASDRMETLLDHLKPVADVIILDTPPSAMLVDAMQVAKFADMVLYVIQSDYARRNVILRGIKELSDTGVKIGGVILNGCKETSSQGYRSSGYYGNYGHYYGKKNG